MNVGTQTVDVVNTLSFSGMRCAVLTALTAPALVSPKGHPNAVKDATGKDCYPWGGSTVKGAGIVKRSTVRGIIGAEWARLVEDARLKTGEGLNADGSATYTHGDATNGTRWVVDGAGDRLAFKTNADESSLYCPIVVTESMGYTYQTVDGTIIPRDVVAPFLRDTSREGVRQGLTNPLVYRDYRIDHIVSVAVGTTLTWGDARRLADALANGGTHPTEGLTARDIAREFAPAIGEGVTG
jgi:hypothetical protein